MEVTGSWGAGLSRWLAANGQAVVEVPRPDRVRRRRKGKSDTLDAEAAARAALAAWTWSSPDAKTARRR